MNETIGQVATSGLSDEKLARITTRMRDELGITSFDDLIDGPVWLSCDHGIHSPVRSIAVMGGIRDSLPVDGAGDVKLLSKDEKPRLILDPKENSGTPGVFNALGFLPLAKDYMRRLNRISALQIGSLTYYSTLALARELSTLNASGLNVIDICASVPAHIEFLQRNIPGFFPIPTNASVHDARNLRPLGKSKYDLVYADIVGAYVDNDDLLNMYEQYYTVTAKGGLLICRERRYTDHQSFIDKRDNPEKVAQVIALLRDLFPEADRDKLVQYVEEHYSAQWGFEAFWERQLETYRQGILSAGFTIVDSVTTIPNTSDQVADQRETITFLAVKQ